MSAPLFNPTLTNAPLDLGLCARVYRGETSSPLTHTVKYGVETGVAIKAHGPHTLRARARACTHTHTRTRTFTETRAVCIYMYVSAKGVKVYTRREKAKPAKTRAV